MQDYQAPKTLLKDKVILVTGAGDGIGKEIAMTFAKYGATILLLGRTTAKLETVYDSIVEAGLPEPAILPVNLEGAVETDYHKIADVIDQEFGRLDGLVLNASLLGSMTPIEQYEAEVWQKVMQVNVHANFLLVKTMIPLLRAADEPSVVFTSSSVGRKGRAFWGAYAVSKFATEGLAQILADEHDADDDFIKFNVINPGATRTNMRASAYPAENPMSIKAPQDIMPLYLYLMGADSTGVTGQSLDAQPK
ncbi:YciK family oxidoreductase [Oleiphilus sp. HI0071]|uniref:YciK family oxidoreductase n=1 Tax=unclassified Oleiphilus TaxID=2631174 RepID=UPI0007C35372|nr:MULTISPECIES: YciK family oxidoreductase [unclassified Oleiphilus]KZY61256.1 YciK family oxidoreductase [Oleiphilus sp. HI0065]KZY81467.1 YciK family oxidoreductase [Oleiphilus sp. HI0071]KZY91663.1 YciK family oxidoreductase [Oleiphilus sp. HI0073]KZZ54702.1 YciK family oxidoreductase [Oleiphilus sp. HI0118]KZZ61856.1 YciK family oxidoreductase [Oleiphilus sp. HI0122]KZZ65971.1 YciK family oxidoreductase [Oleiphilus sp. HI0130]KZZ75418.1 YciK family oxidoreductase [Oleiphilus sp. HI0133]